MLRAYGCRVQQGCSPAKLLLSLVVQGIKKCIAKVRGVAGDVTPTPDAALLVNFFDGRWLGANGVLSGFYYPLHGLLVSTGAVTITHCYAGCYDAFSSATVEAGKVFL